MAANILAGISRPALGNRSDPANARTKTLRALLREQTHAAHTLLETTPLMRAMASGAPSVDEYRGYLAHQYQLHAALETVLAQWVSPEWHRVRLAKADWLRGDLVAMGGSTDYCKVEIPTVGSTTDAMGVLYVIEGGTLGLQVLCKRMPGDHPALRGAGRFMRSYGTETGRNWAAFVAHLEDLPEASWPEAVDAGGRTFAAFQRVFQECPH